MAHVIQWPLVLLGQPALWPKVAQAQSGIITVQLERHNNIICCFGTFLIASQTLSQRLQLVLPNQAYALALGQTSGTLT